VLYYIYITYIDDRTRIISLYINVKALDHVTSTNKAESLR